jgi:hypothetical protein
MGVIWPICLYNEGQDFYMRHNSPSHVLLSPKAMGRLAQDRMAGFSRLTQLYPQATVIIERSARSIALGCYVQIPDDLSYLIGRLHMAGRLIEVEFTHDQFEDCVEACHGFRYEPEVLINRCGFLLCIAGKIINGNQARCILTLDTPPPGDFFPTDHI